MKTKTKLLPLLLLFAMLLTFVSPATVQASENEIPTLSEEAVYDLTIGGTQTFSITDSNGNIAYVTISEEPSISRIDNGTYKITYTEPGCWTAGFHVVISANSITSAKDKFYSVSSGSITQSRLVLESSKQASHYLTYKYGTSVIVNYTGVRSTISGTSLKVSKI